MRIDLPCCGFKNCRYSFDGNCMSLSKQEKCEYWHLLHEELYKPVPSNCSEFPNNWTPCTPETMPEYGQEVLTSDTCGSIWICSLIFTGSNNEVCWEDNYGYLYNLDNQIAWMPLPEPYQPKGGIRMMKWEAEERGLDCNDCYWSMQNCKDKSICCEDETGLCDWFEPIPEEE